MNTFEHLSDLDPFINLQNEWSLPPQPFCARLSDVLALVEPRLGSALVDAAGRAVLRSVAECIPARLSSFWGFEIRLGDPSPRADLLWEIVQGSGGIPMLAGRKSEDPGADIASALRARSPFWQELGRFAEEWLDNPDWLRRLANIWLEADTASVAAATGAELDVCLDRPSLFWGPNARVTGSDRDLVRYLGALGRRFYGLNLDQARIDSIVDAIPDEGKVFQMGVMGGRTAPAARLCVKDLDAEVMERWLDEIGWPGDRASLRDTLARLAALSGEIALNVDILPDRIGPKLGLELYSAERMLAMDTWRPLHDDLLASGLVRADKLAALEDFPWHQRYRQFGVWRLTPPIGFPVVATNLHHLKLNFVGDEMVEAKAYLSVFRPAIDYSPTQGDDLEGGGGWL